MTRLRVACGPILAIIGAAITLAAAFGEAPPLAFWGGMFLAALGALVVIAELEHRDATASHGVDAHRQAMQALKPPTTWTTTERTHHS